VVITTWRTTGPVRAPIVNMRTVNITKRWTWSNACASYRDREFWLDPGEAPAERSPKLSAESLNNFWWRTIQGNAASSRRRSTKGRTPRIVLLHMHLGAQHRAAAHQAQRGRHRGCSGLARRIWHRVVCSGARGLRAGQFRLWFCTAAPMRHGSAGPARRRAGHLVQR